jgi:hypothetical protein
MSLCWLKSTINVHAPVLSPGVVAARQIARGVQLLLYIHEPIVLHYTFSATWSSALQMPRPQCHGQVCNEIIRCLSASVAHEDTPTIVKGKFRSCIGSGQRYTYNQGE